MSTPAKHRKGTELSRSLSPVDRLAGCLHSPERASGGESLPGSPPLSPLKTNADGRLHVRLRSLQLPAGIGVTRANRSYELVTQLGASAEASQGSPCGYPQSRYVAARHSSLHPYPPPHKTESQSYPPPAAASPGGQHKEAGTNTDGMQDTVVTPQLPTNSFLASALMSTAKAEPRR
jgi:hypothetical protein